MRPDFWALTVHKTIRAEKRENQSTPAVFVWAMMLFIQIEGTIYYIERAGTRRLPSQKSVSQPNFSASFDHNWYITAEFTSIISEGYTFFFKIDQLCKQRGFYFGNFSIKTGIKTGVIWGILKPRKVLYICEMLIELNYGEWGWKTWSLACNVSIMLNR